MRIIAGSLKGRRLAAPSWDGLRPTSDKLRGTLFNILMPRIAGARLFDGYAGTGAIGLEALSRGAAHVTFAERDRRALGLIEQNIAGCGVTEGYTIERGDVAAALTRHGEPFDVILLDPPYDLRPLMAVLDATAQRVTADGLVILERAARTEPEIPASLRRTRDVMSGDSALTFFRRRVE